MKIRIFPRLTATFTTVFMTVFTTVFTAVFRFQPALTRASAFRFTFRFTSTSAFTLPFLFTLAILFSHSIQESVYAQQDFTSPYGTCAHLADPGENDFIPRNIDLMREAGLKWSRSDIRWRSVEPRPGEWHFERADRMVKAAEERNLNILVILGYQSAYCGPVWEHLAEWKNYVRTVVTRYKGHVKHWEIWNEENIPFGWDHDGCAQEYLPVLQAAYETIKELDPNATVVFGGMAGIGSDYVEASLKLGAGKWFDVMNIHPYRGALSSMKKIAAFQSDIQKIHELLEKYGAGEKPLWITEMGWATPPYVGRTTRKAAEAAFQLIFREQGGKPAELAQLRDERFQPSLGMSDSDWEMLIPEGIPTRFVTLDEISALDIRKTPALYFPPTLDFPVDFYAEVQEYVKRGGTILLMRDLPMYETTERAEDGSEKPKYFSHDLIHGMRVNWLAWWKHKKENVPETSTLCAAPGWEDFFHIAENQVGDRFFDGKYLHDGDELIPLLEGKTDTFTGTVAGVYRFHSDWKGNIVVSGLRTDCFLNVNRTTVQKQGNNLAQALLIALSSGVERFFSYEFQSVERDEFDPESHFGIMHKNLTPKTGYTAYKTLISARPAGSKTLFCGEKDGLYVISWNRPDGRRVTAAWAPGTRTRTRFPQEGELSEAFDVLGNPLEIPADGIWTFENTIYYGIGK